VTTELGDFQRRRQTIPSLDFRPLAQLAPTPPRAPRTAPGPRPRAVTALDLDALQFYALLRVPVVKFNVVGVIAADAGHFSGIELALSFKISLDPVALARLLRRAPVVLGIRVQRLDELLLDPRLVLAVVLCGTVTRYLEDFTYVCDIIGAIAPITANLAGIELRAAA